MSWQPGDPVNKIIEEDLERILAYDLPWKDLRGVRVLITGGTGFVGSWLAMTCAKAGAKVAITTRRHGPEAEAISDFGISVYECRTNLLAHPLTDFDPAIIIHAAGPGDPKEYLARPANAIEINTLGMSQCLAQAIDGKATVMLISSGEVYGNKISDGLPLFGGALTNDGLAEGTFGPLDPQLPRSCYAEAKRCAEALCFAYGRQYGVPTRVARLFHSYGPGMALDDSRVVPAMLAAVLLGANPVVRSKAKRTFLYATDMVTGLMTVLLKGKDDEPYNVGSACEHEVRVVGELLNNGIVDYAPAQDDDSPHQALKPDAHKLQLLGWYPMVDLVEGLKRTKESYGQLH
jgi:dTDP-glucose 4,6-dehydratase